MRLHGCLENVTPMAKVYTIDGSQFGTLEEFFEQISLILIPGADWGRNLDAFNDILRGGFGTPDDGFEIHWTQSNTSRARLGYAETVKQLEARVERCHPSNRPKVSQQLAEARSLKLSRCTEPVAMRRKITCACASRNVGFPPLAEAKNARSQQGRQGLLSGPMPTSQTDPLRTFAAARKLLRPFR